MKVKRIMVIGACGSGKSTFSQQLQNVTGLPIFHLDQFYWKPNWEETNKADWEEIVTKLSQKEKWIIDGNFSSTMDIRMAKADVIIYLHQATVVLLYRITKRIVLNFKKKRPDMAEGCEERFDREFYQFVATFNRDRMPVIFRKLKQVEKDKKVLILRGKKDIEQTLKSLI